MRYDRYSRYVQSSAYDSPRNAYGQQGCYHVDDPNLRPSRNRTRSPERHIPSAVLRTSSAGGGPLSALKKAQRHQRLVVAVATLVVLSASLSFPRAPPLQKLRRFGEAVRDPSCRQPRSVGTGFYIMHSDTAALRTVW